MKVIYEKVCLILRKYVKSWKSMLKLEKVLESVLKAKKVWESASKVDKLWKSVLLAKRQMLSAHTISKFGLFKVTFGIIIFGFLLTFVWHFKGEGCKSLS